MSERTTTRAGRLAPLVSALLALAACRPADEQFRDFAPARSTGPEVEPEPSRLERPTSCAEGLDPEAHWIAVAGAPVAGAIRRVYHLCLGQHVALLQLRGLPGRRVVQVVLEQEIFDVHGQRPSRRMTITLARVFDPGTVRYHRLRWREGRANPGERGLRLRLRAVDFADGTRWSAPPWPPSPRAVSDGKRPRAPSLQRGLDRTRRSLRRLTKAVRDRRVKMEKRD